MTRDLADTITTVCRDAVAEPFFAIPNSNDPLRVPIPCKIVDSSGNNVVFT